MTRTARGNGRGLAQLQQDLGRTRRRTRVAETLTIDDGGPVTCQLSLSRIESLAPEVQRPRLPGARGPGPSLADLAAEVERASIAPFEPPAADAPPPVPVPAADRSPGTRTDDGAIAPMDAMPAPVSGPPASPPPAASEHPVAGTTLPAESPADDPLAAEVLAQDLAGLTGVSAALGAATSSGRPPTGDSTDPDGVFERIRMARELGTEATGASTDVFDRIGASRAQATTFNLGSFSVQQRFDGFDRMMDARPVAARPPAPAAPAVESRPIEGVAGAGPESVIEGVTEDEIHADLESLRQQIAPRSPAATPPPASAQPDGPAEVPDEAAVTGEAEPGPVAETETATEPQAGAEDPRGPDHEAEVDQPANDDQSGSDQSPSDSPPSTERTSP